jgi:hypothetical protein
MIRSKTSLDSSRDFIQGCEGSFEKSKMHQRSSNLHDCVILVHELPKCVIPVPNRCVGLTKVQMGLIKVPSADMKCQRG